MVPSPTPYDIFEPRGHPIFSIDEATVIALALLLLAVLLLLIRKSAKNQKKYTDKQFIAELQKLHKKGFNELVHSRPLLYKIANETSPHALLLSTQLRHKLREILKCIERHRFAKLISQEEVQKEFDLWIVQAQRELEEMARGQNDNE